MNAKQLIFPSLNHLVLNRSPRTLWPPSCLCRRPRRPLWRWWETRTSGQTPAPPADWRWGSPFPGPRVHLCRSRGAINHTAAAEISNTFTNKKGRVLRRKTRSSHPGHKWRLICVSFKRWQMGSKYMLKNGSQEVFFFFFFTPSVMRKLISGRQLPQQMLAEQRLDESRREQGFSHDEEHDTGKSGHPSLKAPFAE